LERPSKLLFIAAMKGNAMKPDTQLDYRILSRSNASFLEEDVAEHTHDGYRLIGGVSVYIDEDGKPVFNQAVAR
jgi:Domain of unknown function (DUF1737)